MSNDKPRKTVTEDEAIDIIIDTFNADEKMSNDKQEPSKRSIEIAAICWCDRYDKLAKENEVLTKENAALLKLVREHVTACDECIDAMCEGYTICGDCSCE